MEHITPLPFHERLKYEREQRGWSQEYLAGKVGSDPKTVDGGRGARDDLKLKIAESWLNSSALMPEN